MSNFVPFQLSTSLEGHDLDVKAVSSPNDNIIISASRDQSARLWSRISANAFEESKIYLGHSNFVNSITYVKPSEKYPQGLIVSGSSDKTINVFDAENAGEPIYSLIGHSGNICTLEVTPSNHIISGSWDKTAKIWINWQDSCTLKGHSQAVWAVLAWSDELILTGSADKSIIKWQNGKRIHTYKGHTDCVRGLALLQNIGFVSCANDSTLRIWTLDGQCIQELSGHVSFVYSIDVLPSGEIISGGEDRSIKVWKDSTCIQTILFPATSVWCVTSMPNGDIVSGSSDGIIRVFTRVPELGDLNKETLPGSEALLRPGETDGQVLMVRNGDLVEAHQWSEASKSWKKVGEVVDAVGQNRKQLYNGIEYDYVFDVDVGEGMPPLKLPYNATAAQQFIWANELPQSYLDQVADFITTNAQGVSIGTANQYSDPFTGGSRYTPGTSSSSIPSNTRPNYLDPWTSSGASSSGTSETKKIIPQKTYLTFRQANLQAILKKFNQFNNELKDVSLSSEEFAILENLTKFLQNPDPKLASSPEREKEFLIIKKALTLWPSNYLFPGIDLLRLLSLYTSIPAQYSDEKGSIVKFIESVIGISSWVGDEQLSKEKETNLMLYFKVLANLFDSKEGRDVIRKESVALLESERDSEVVYRALVTLGTLIFCHASAKDAAKVFDVKIILKNVSGKEPRITSVYDEILKLI
nr:2161_t:CDS:10 [Entrophospora candida]